MATGRGGRTRTQRKSAVTKSPSRATSAASKKIAKLNKGISKSGTGRRAQDNNAARRSKIATLNSRTAHGSEHGY